VIQTGTIAAVAVACARFGGVLWSGLGSRILLGHGSFGISGERLGAIAVIGLLTAVNLRGLFLGKLVQNAFTSAKVVSLLLIVVLGCVIAPNDRALRANFGSATAFSRVASARSRFAGGVWCRDGRWPFLLRRLGQRHVYRLRSA